MSNKTVSAPRIAIVAITRHGARHAQRLGELLPGSELVIAEKFAYEVTLDSGRVRRYTGSIKAHIEPLMEAYDLIALFVSIGAVVRLIAPYIKSKETDPGIVVIDNAAQFVVPVLAGHIGGANDFAEQIAGLLSAMPVITTASDAGNTISVDILGREFGWQIDAPKQNVTTVSACVVNKELIAFVQETGERGWWKYPAPLPANIVCYNKIEDVDFSTNPALIWVTDRSLHDDLANQLGHRWVIYRIPDKK